MDDAVNKKLTFLLIFVWALEILEQFWFNITSLF